MSRTMRGVVAIGIVTTVAIIWTLRDSRGVGEWLRRMTDGPTNLMLIGTSGFEREGRDPAKGPERS